MEVKSPVPGTDCGTAVYVSLPQAPKPTVAVLSQDAATAAFLKERVTAQGYGLIFTESGKEALEVCFTQQPAVFVLDERIADMDVRDVVLQLREENKTKRLPVIVLGLRQLERSEVEMYRHFGIFYSTLPWHEKDFARALAMAVLGKLR